VRRLEIAIPAATQGLSFNKFWDCVVESGLCALFIIAIRLIMVPPLGGSRFSLTANETSLNNHEKCVSEVTEPEKFREEKQSDKKNCPKFEITEQAHRFIRIL
jgi:hypothetical protein